MRQLNQARNTHAFYLPLSVSLTDYGTRLNISTNGTEHILPNGIRFALINTISGLNMEYVLARKLLSQVSDAPKLIMIMTMKKRSYYH